jgi:hypothetical protein
MTLEELVKVLVLRDILSGMSPEERKALLARGREPSLLSSVNEQLSRQQAVLERLEKSSHGFAFDFLSNVAGNAAWDTALYVARKIFRL